MNLNFGPRNVLQIDDARITFRNFSGVATQYNRSGDRNFALVIPDQEIATALMDNKNEYGVAWNVKIKEPREEGDEPFIYLPVKVNFSGRGPKVYLICGNSRTRLDENTIGLLDEIDIESVDLDIRPYDGDGNYGPFRSAYLQAMYVTQAIDRLDMKYADRCREE